MRIFVYLLLLLFPIILSLPACKETALPKEEVVEDTPIDLSAIEVEKKGKKEEEGEAGPTETKE